MLWLQNKQIWFQCYHIEVHSIKTWFCTTQRLRSVNSTRYSVLGPFRFNCRPPPHQIQYNAKRVYMPSLLRQTFPWKQIQWPPLTYLKSKIENLLLENFSALATDVVQFLSFPSQRKIPFPRSFVGDEKTYHASISGSLLRLKEDGFFLTAFGALLVRAGKLKRTQNKTQHVSSRFLNKRRSDKKRKRLLSSSSQATSHS